MSQFGLYFNLGIQHILDFQGFDHLLFVIALCVVFTWREWKKVIILVTSFTIGHSVTLSLAALNVIRINSEIIEFLIPLTILITALSNIFKKSNSFSSSKVQLNYFYAAFFGLVHGLGFSNYLRTLLGGSSEIVTQLLAFNLGIEAGQILIVAVFLLITGLAAGAGVNRREWNLTLSSGIAGMAFMLVLDNIYW